MISAATSFTTDPVLATSPASVARLTTDASTTEVVPPTPTPAETRAFGGSLENWGPAMVTNPEPVVQQLLMAEQAKRRLEATVKLLTAQLQSQTMRYAVA